MAKAVTPVGCMPRHKRSCIEIMLKIVLRKNYRISVPRKIFSSSSPFLWISVPHSGLDVLDLTTLTSVNYTE